VNWIANTSIANSTNRKQHRKQQPKVDVPTLKVMPTGKKWTSDECEALAKAWINVSEDTGEGEVKGTDQTSETFWGRVVDYLKTLAPKDAKECAGRFHRREGNALKTNWNDKIARDVKKFNRALLKVLASNLTGVNEQNKINIAVSIMVGKTDAASYRHKDFDPYEWIYYKAWLVLRGHPTFMPPNLKEGTDETEPEEDELPNLGIPDDPANMLVTPPLSRRDSDLSNPSSLKPKALSKAKSRGPGPGRKATREQSLAEENAKRKIEVLERIAATMERNTQLNEKKVKACNQLVRSTTRAQAFMVGYKGQKVEGQTPHERMHYQNIMNNAVNMEDSAEDASIDYQDDDPKFPLEEV
jgi:hypothetical protein